MPRGARLHECGGVREGEVAANHLDLFRTPSALYPATLTLYSSEATVLVYRKYNWSIMISGNTFATIVSPKVQSSIFSNTFTTIRFTCIRA